MGNWWFVNYQLPIKRPTYFSTSYVYDAYNMSRTAAEADYKALLSDWCIVGQDIQDAMTAFECSLPAQSREGTQFELFGAR
jgi:hypothetical protein